MRKFVITVNGKSYEVEVEEITQGEVAAPSAPAAAPASTAASESASSAAPVSTPVESKPASTAPSASIPKDAEIVKAPMPGTILDIKVKPGDQVAKGQTLLILEAMKMENEIVCPRDAKVVSIQVATGSSVNAGDALVAIE